MTESLSNSLLSQFSEFIVSRTALYFPCEHWNDLETKAGSAARKFGYTDTESFIRWLISSPVSRDQIEMLASHLTISETYFWREPQVFDALVEHILPELIRSREGSGKILRIWSAGCSTGEEPYSIAIALQKAVPALEEWNITILATDINPGILRKANAGIYGEWSFRNAPPWLKDRYFLRRDDGKLEILPEIKKMVAFSYLNLAEDIYPSPINNTGAMDIIFCRNVLMYFAPGRVQEVVRGLYRSLTDGGWLMVSSSELSQHIFPQFAPVNFPGAVVYRKQTSVSRSLVITYFEDILFQKEIAQPALEIFEETEQPVLPHLFPDGSTTEENEQPAVRQAVYEGVLDILPGKGDAKKTDETAEEDKHISITAMIRTLADNGKLSEALALCDKAITGDKLDPGLYYLRAVILQEENRFDEAVTSLKHCLYIDPNHALAYFTMGNLVLHQGDVKFAKRCFDNALALMTACKREDILPESEGLTAGRFREIIQATINIGALS
jgi:chemotaxis protein methyltransferase CheR